MEIVQPTYEAAYKFFDKYKKYRNEYKNSFSLAEKKKSFNEHYGPDSMPSPKMFGSKETIAEAENSIDNEKKHFTELLDYTENEAKNALMESEWEYLNEVGDVLGEFVLDDHVNYVISEFKQELYQDLEHSSADSSSTKIAKLTKIVNAFHKSCKKLKNSP
jgi:hypothetical protein